MKSRGPTTTEPTGQASAFDRQNVTESAGSARSVGRTPERDDRVPEPGAVDVERDGVAVRDLGDGAGVLGGERLAHRVGVGVLDGDQAADRLVRVGRVAEGRVDLGEVHRAVGPVLERPDARADDHGMTGRLVDDEMVLAAGDRLLTAREVGHLGDEVAHRAARHEQAGLLAEQLGGAFLEGVDRRVVTEDVVADLGLGHRPAHGGRRVGDGVAAQVDPGHGGRVYGWVAVAGPDARRAPLAWRQPRRPLLCSALAATGPVV